LAPFSLQEYPVIAKITAMNNTKLNLTYLVLF